MRKFHKLFSFFIFIMISFTQSRAQHWMKTNPVTSTTSYVELAVDQDGTNYAAYVDDPPAGGDSGLLHVKKYDGVNWIEYGNTGMYSTGIASFTSFFVSNGVVYVSFSDVTVGRRVSVAVSDNKGNWSIAGTRGVTGPGSSNFGLAKDPVTGSIYGYYQTADSTEPVIVKQFISNSWSKLPKPVFAPQIYSSLGISLTSFNGIVYLAYGFHYVGDSANPTGNYISIAKFLSGGWSNFTYGIGTRPLNSNPLISIDPHPEYRRLLVSYLTYDIPGRGLLAADALDLSTAISTHDLPLPLEAVAGIQPFIVSTSQPYPYIAVTGTPNNFSSAKVFDIANNSPLGLPYFSPYGSFVTNSTVSATKVMVATSSSESGAEVYFYPFNQAHAFSVTSSAPNGLYGIGTEIDLQVHTDHTVNVIGTPLLKLKTGNPVPGFANYFSGSGTNTLTFKYFVRANDSTQTLDYVDSISLIPNGGAILNAADNEGIDLTLPSPGTTGSLSSTSSIALDGVRPVINSVSLPPGGWFKAGSVLQFTLNYNDTVTVTSGSPSIGLTIGTAKAMANYVSGSGTNALVFSYTVKTGDNGSFALDTVVTTNGAVIADVVNNIALNSIPVSDAHQIIADTRNPVFIINAGASYPLYVGTSYPIIFTSADDPATGLTAAGINATNATISNFTNVSYGVYSATFTPVAAGLVSISVNAGSAFDLAGNPNDASPVYSAQAINIGSFKSISPNPAHNTLNVNFTGAGDGVVCRVMLTNTITGQVLLNKNGTVYGNTVAFDISAVPRGSYTCTINWPYNTSNSVSIHLNVAGH